LKQWLYVILFLPNPNGQTHNQPLQQKQPQPSQPARAHTKMPHEQTNKSTSTHKNAS